MYFSLLHGYLEGSGSEGKKRVNMAWVAAALRCDHYHAYTFIYAALWGMGLNIKDWVK